MASKMTVRRLAVKVDCVTELRANPLVTRVVLSETLTQRIMNLIHCLVIDQAEYSIFLFLVPIWKYQVIPLEASSGLHGLTAKYRIPIRMSNYLCFREKSES